nr:MAG TPA: hypothetical protein [Caudoviricetes sp.]
MEKNLIACEIVLEGIQGQIKSLKEQKQEYIKELKEDGKLTFELWKKYADKSHYSFILSKDEAPLIRGIMDENDYWERRETIDLSYFLDIIEEENIDDSELDIEALKKELMDLNYGSMVMDW